MSAKIPSIKKGLARTPAPEPQPLPDWPHVMVELREVGPEDRDGGGERYKLRWRYVVVADPHDDQTRAGLRELRRRGLYAGPLLGDELKPTPGSTKRGVPLDYDGTDPRLCNACCATGRPCRAVALPSGRCRWHGGLSTGPKTPEGRARSALNLVKARAVLAARRAG